MTAMDLAGDVAAGNVQAIQTGTRGRHQHRVLPGHVGGQAIQRVDVVEHVLGEAAVGGQAAGAMAFGSVAVIQARGVHAEQAVVAAATAFVGFDGYPVARREFVDVLAEGDHGAGPLVAGCELAERRLRRVGLGLDLEIGAAHAAHRDFDEHLAWARHGTALSTTRKSFGPNRTAARMVRGRLTSNTDRRSACTLVKPPGDVHERPC